MLRLALPILPLLATPVLAHEGPHLHPHGIEYGWLALTLLGSVIGGGLVYAVLRRRK